MTIDSPISGESKATIVAKKIFFGVYMSVVFAVLALNFTDFFEVDDNSSQPAAECMSPEDECELFQPVQDNDLFEIDPYEPTPFGTEAIDGHVPPALAIQLCNDPQKCHNTFAMKFMFGEQSDDLIGHEFIMPLQAEDVDVINNEYPEMAEVITRVAELEGITQLMITHGSLAVNHSEDVDFDLLKRQITMLIGNYG